MAQAIQPSLAELRYLFGGAKGHLLNQTELAEAIGVTQAYISMIERGKKKPSQYLIDRYARFYRIEREVVRAAIAETARRARSGSRQVRSVF